MSIEMALVGVAAALVAAVSARVGYLHPHITRKKSR